MSLSVRLDYMPLSQCLSDRNDSRLEFQTFIWLQSLRQKRYHHMKEFVDEKRNSLELV